jgi:signal recognition particle receptor subunit beta
MPIFHHSIKQVHLKIVYYGPGLGGKTTNLKYIHAHSRKDLRGRLLSLSTETERTLFFDLLPIELGDFRGYSIRLHLCTVPGQIAYDETRRLVLRHVDGVVFVADSQEAILDSNLESMSNLQTNLELLGEDSRRLPLVVQYNKRDLPGVLPVDYLQAMLGVPAEVPQIEAVASQGVGVFETMKSVVKQCVRLIDEPARAPSGRSPSILPGARPSLIPGARPPASPAPLWPEENSAEIAIPQAAVPRFHIEAIDDPFAEEIPAPHRSA